MTERQSREVHGASLLHVGRELGAGGMSGSDVTERRSREVHVASLLHVGERGAEGMSGSGKEAYVWIHGSSQPREI